MFSRTPGIFRLVSVVLNVRDEIRTEYHSIVFLSIYEKLKLFHLKFSLS